MLALVDSVLFHSGLNAKVFANLRIESSGHADNRIAGRIAHADDVGHTIEARERIDALNCHFEHLTLADSTNMPAVLTVLDKQFLARNSLRNSRQGLVADVTAFQTTHEHVSDKPTLELHSPDGGSASDQLSIERLEVFCAGETVGLPLRPTSSKASLALGNALLSGNPLALSLNCADQASITRLGNAFRTNNEGIAGCRLDDVVILNASPAIST